MNKLGIIMVTFLILIFSCTDDDQGPDSSDDDQGSDFIDLSDAKYAVSYEVLAVKDILRSYKLTYRTIDVFGDTTIASGAIFIPRGSCNSYPMISWQHPTTFNRNTVPSNEPNSDIGVYFAENGYIVLLPDYLGLGENMGIHPYIHWESEATASLDLIRGTREFLNKLNITDNNQLFLAGYSQGGHATMAIHKYIQLHDLKNEFNIIASVPMSGPYSLSYDEVDFIFNNATDTECGIFLTIVFASYQMIYGNLYSDYTEYYDPPYDEVIESWVSTGVYEDNLPSNLYQFMQDSVVDNIIANAGHPFRMDLRKNDLHNWCPLEPVRMLYCGMDQIVSSQNSITARDTMIVLGAPDVMAIEMNPQGDHFSCFDPCIQYALEFFDNLAEECKTVSIKSTN